LGATSSAMAAPTIIPLIKRPIVHLPFLSCMPFYMAVFLLDLNSWRQIIYLYLVRVTYLKKIQFGANGLHSIRSMLCCWYGMIPKNSDAHSLIVHLFRNYVTWLLDVNKVTTSSMNIDDDQQMKANKFYG
jgi:hypothetical protein